MWVEVSLLTGFFMVNALKSVPPESVAVISEVRSEAHRFPLISRLLDLLGSKDYRPPQLPSTATQLTQLSQQENICPTEMVQLLSRDPMLAGELLRIAQSPAYGGASSIRSLEEAIVRLGLQRTGELFVRVALESRVFRVAGYQEPMRQLQRHSACVAQIAPIIARAAKVPSKSAFLCGLLHDIGTAATLIALVDSIAAKDPIPPFAEVEPAVQKLHHYAGGLVAKEWNFPQDIIDVVEQHHGCVRQENPLPMACVVNLADHIASQMGYGFGSELTNDSPDTVLELLKLNQVAADALWLKCRKQLEKMA